VELEAGQGARACYRPSSLSLVVGLFVGGCGARMGGVVKGNLPGPGGERLLERLVGECAKALPNSVPVLIGDAAAHSDLGLRTLADAPAGIGPLGGLRALLLHAKESGAWGALALACDLPYLSAPLIARLATESPEALFVAPREGALWHTLVARYSVLSLSAVDATLAAGERALQRVVGRLGDHARVLALTPAELDELRDWDTPDDVRLG
jgi:molybdopterin-guanine dinucleotide biosynthesis protein A